MPRQSFADIEELEAHVLFETSHLLRQPYLTTHQKAEARELLSDAANACAAFNSGLRPLIQQGVDDAKRGVERLEGNLRAETELLEHLERQLRGETESDDDSSSLLEHDNEMKREAERAQTIAQIAEASSRANGLRSLKAAVHAAHMRIARRITHLLNMPVREGFPPPIYE